MADEITQIVLYCKETGGWWCEWARGRDTHIVEVHCDGPLDDAIRQACYDLNFDLTPEDFGRELYDHYAIWRPA